MTIDEIKAKAEMLIKNSRETQGEFVQVYNNGFEDGLNFVLQNLQQADCSTPFDFLVQLANKEHKVADELQDASLKDLHLENVRAIQRILRIIKEQMQMA